MYQIYTRSIKVKKSCKKYAKPRTMKKHNMARFIARRNKNNKTLNIK